MINGRQCLKMLENDYSHYFIDHHPLSSAIIMANNGLIAPCLTLFSMNIGHCHDVGEVIAVIAMHSSRLPAWKARFSFHCRRPAALAKRSNGPTLAPWSKGRSCGEDATAKSLQLVN